jgi:hypothetical protein
MPYTASVVQWSESLVIDPEVLGSNPGSTRFSEKYWVSLMSTIEELLGRKGSGSGLENLEYSP